MNCPSCGAPMHLIAGNASLQCAYCRTVVTVQPDDSGIAFLDKASADLICPACDVALWNATIAGNQLHACKHCSGVLVAMGALEQVIDQLRATITDSQIPSTPPNPDDLRRKIDCPQCHQRMDVYFYMGGGGAAIGGCERCNLNWLDGGTLMRIVRAPNHENANTRLW